MRSCKYLNKQNFENFLLFLCIFTLLVIYTVWDITIDSKPETLFKTNGTDFLKGNEWCSKKMCFNMSNYNEFQYIIEDNNSTFVKNYDNNIRESTIITIILFIIGLILPCIYFLTKDKFSLNQ